MNLMKAFHGLTMNEEDRLITIKRVRTADGEPVVYCIDQVLAKNFPVGTEELHKYLNI